MEANRGLIALRQGLFDVGRAHYQKAIQGFRQKELTDSERLARAFFAKEAAAAKLPEAEKLIKEAEPSRGQTLAAHVAHVLKAAKDIFASHMRAENRA